jgi:nucleotide-binding universal stress UspA family protein
VLGTHGKGVLDQALFGSTTERVVRKAPCPVLTVRIAEHEFVDD